MNSTVISPHEVVSPASCTTALFSSLRTHPSRTHRLPANPLRQFPIPCRFTVEYPRQVEAGDSHGGVAAVGSALETGPDGHPLPVAAGRIGVAEDWFVPLLERVLRLAHSVWVCNVGCYSPLPEGSFLAFDPPRGRVKLLFLVVARVVFWMGLDANIVHVSAT